MASQSLEEESTDPGAEARTPAQVPLSASTAPLRALDASRDAAVATVTDHLVTTTGPLAELTAAELRGVLDATRRRLIARKTAGVVFEGTAVMRLQDARERYGLNLVATLAGSSNAERADIVLHTAHGHVELQLKTGTDKYIRAAVRARKEGVVLLVPRDAEVALGDAWVRSAVELESVVIESPTRAELVSGSEVALDRLSRGESSLSMADLARTSVANSLIDGLSAVVVDLCIQRLTASEKAIDWERAAKCLLKTATTSAASSFFAGVMTKASLARAGRAADAVACMRASRVASSIVPRAIDTVLDLARVKTGELTDQQFERQLARNIGATAAEVLGFQLLARITSRMGPVGRTIVTLLAHFVLTAVGALAGELLYDTVRALAAPASERPLLGVPLAGERTIDVTKESRELVDAMDREHSRRAAVAARGLCEEAGCRRRHHARGMCNTHYMRWWRRARTMSERRI